MQVSDCWMQSVRGLLALSGDWPHQSTPPILTKSSQLGSCKGDPVGTNPLLLEVAQRAIQKESINSYQLSRSVLLMSDLLFSTALRRCTDHRSNGPKRCGCIANHPSYLQTTIRQFLFSGEQHAWLAQHKEHHSTRYDVISLAVKDNHH